MDQKLYKFNKLVNAFNRDSILLDRTTKELIDEMDEIKTSRVKCKVCGDVHTVDELGCDESDCYETI